MLVYNVWGKERIRYGKRCISRNKTLRFRTRNRFPWLKVAFPLPNDNFLRLKITIQRRITRLYPVLP